MKPFSAFLVTSLMAVVLFISCSRDTVNLEFTNARGELPQLTNLVFRFSKPLVADSLLNQWDSTPFVRFEPAIPGRFRWEHPDELVFSPARPLPPATSFKASLSNELLQYSTYNSIGKAETIQFSTPLVRLENTNITWLAADGALPARPQIDLYFNYPVDPSLLKEKLQIRAGDRQLAYSVQTLSVSSQLTVQLTDLKMEDKDLSATVSLAKGIIPAGGANPSAEVLEAAISIPSPYNLVINDVVANHDGNGGTILVRSSQQIAPGQLADFIKIEPAVKFSTELSNDGFVINSNDFRFDKTYQLTLKKGLRGTIGGVLREETYQQVAFGQLEPSVQFTNNKGVYLAARGEQQIEVKIVNVPRVKVVISKIYESNLLAALRYGYYPNDNRNEGDDYYDDNSSDLELGDIIYEQEIETQSLPRNGDARLFTFNPDDRLSSFNGIYHIRIRSADDYWINDSRFISKTDLGLIAREAKDKLVVFVNSLKTATAVEGVNIVAYGSNNQVLGTGSSDANGVAEVNYTRREFAGFKPAMIIARTAADFNYLPFANTRVNTSRFEVGGKQINPSGLDAFVYAERDIYRPGEQVHFSVILRDKNWKSPGELPVQLKFLLPNGKELKNFRKSLNSQGALEGAVDISANAITGTYMLEVYTSTGILLATRNFSVEEFVPDRIRVTALLDKTSLSPGQSTQVQISAVNFFGPPAANRNYEYEVQVKQKAFRPQKYPQYDFSVSNPTVTFEKQVDEGKTDAEGKASKTYSVPENFANTGVLQANFFATVFDETGRPVSRNTSLSIYTQPVFFGIATDGYWYHSLNQPIRFPLLAVNKDGVAISGQASVKVIKREYRTQLVRSGGYFRYQSQEELKVVAEQSLQVSGESTSYTFIPRSPGNYEIRVSVPGASSYVSSTFYSYGSWGGDYNSFEVNTDGNIDIELDKSGYLAGETVKALFKTPFSGRMLVTLETDQLVHYQYVDVENRSASVDFKLSGSHLPNVYITATLIKPHEVSDMPLTVAHGYRNINVEEKGRKMELEIKAAAAVRSLTRQKISVTALPGSMVTLALVDNGILQVSDFKTPNPYQFFYAQRALGVTGYDLYPLLFPELRARLSSTGGDGDLNMNKRTNPMPAKRVQLVSWWSGIRTVGTTGKVDFEVDIPAFSGELRLMAVAYKDEHFGSAELAMKVADPLVLSTALPRFLSPGDTVAVPVTITNTTSRTGKATARISVTGPLRVTGSTTQSATLAANSEAQVVFQVVAAAAINTGKVLIDVNGLGEQFKSETAIGVRPASPLQLRTGTGQIAGGQTQTIVLDTTGYLPGSLDYQLVLSKNPALELGKQLRYLVQYPYGCTEQTISVAFPQLYYDDLAAGAASNGSATVNILEAIRKIKVRQLYNGAVTLWDGESTEHWWSSVFAAHFLLEARKAGFDSDKSLLDGLLLYLESRLRNRETILYYYNQKETKKIAPKEVAYSLYVLALAGRPNAAVMNYYKSNPQLLSLDSRYLLSVAYAIAGDRQRFKEFLPGSFSGERAQTQTGGSFYSEIRDEAIALNALIDADPENSQIGIMTRHVSELLKQRSWFSTQECAFSLVALGKMARSANNATVTATLTVNGKAVGKTAGGSLKLTARQLGGNKVEVSSTGQGRLYYFWETAGIRADAVVKEEDNFIRARRKFFDRFGNPLTGNRFSQNQLVIVQLTLENAYSGSVENIVLSDLLPAGFEIENPRTREIPGMDWIKDASTPTAMDVRDDRINLFVDLRKGKQTYYYAVRAVSPGVFRMGPVSADAMYNGEYHSYHGAGIIRIE